MNKKKIKKLFEILVEIETSGEKRNPPQNSIKIFKVPPSHNSN